MPVAHAILTYRPAWLRQRKYEAQLPQGWYPPALRWWSLIPTVLFCWCSIAVLQYFLHKSQTEGGVIFSPDVNKLPLRQSFVYLYLPTIVAVIFSIFIVWIDHDAKRYEPYRQMFKLNGALGKDSLLLHYPFKFIPFVPFVAAKRRHWLVFWASCATITTTFGVVPLQAGIFSTKSISRTFPQDFNVSGNFIPASQQQAQLTLAFASSVYGILELNETLPGFMTRDYVLRPFNMDGESEAGSWSTQTIKYDLDLVCKGVEPTSTEKSNDLQNSRIIGFSPSGNPALQNRRYSGNYAGYFPAADRDWFEGKQPARARDGDSEGFDASFGENRASEKEPLKNWTSISCLPTYYQQEVNATIDALTKAPVEIHLLGERQQLPPDLFNNTYFEHVLAAGSRVLRSREYNLPVEVLPRYLDRLYRSELSPTMDHKDPLGLPPMLAMAMTTSKFPMHDLLDRSNLIEAYRQAYGLLFARAMVDVLEPDYTTEGSKSTGVRLQRTQAVTLEPVFTYIVEGLLMSTSLMILAVYYLGVRARRNGQLIDDPGSLATVMSMIAESSSLLHTFDCLDGSSSAYLQHCLSNHVAKVRNVDGIGCTLTSTQNQKTQTTLPGSQAGQRLTKPMRPIELRLPTAVPFVSLFVILMIFAAVVFAQANSYGLPLPSKNPVILNLLTEYLPTAIATLIEPMWILINRLLCLLQPLEELRGSRATAAKSIALNYNSLPPQLTLVKAARAGHVILFLVCAMSLLSNLLATAFAGLFFSATVPMSRPALFVPPLQPRFVSINGSAGPPWNGFPTRSSFVPSGAYQGGTGEDLFLIAESNYTRNTSLPSWTDGESMYLPFRSSNPADISSSKTYRARTKYFTAAPNCRPLTWSIDYSIRVWNDHLLPNGSQFREYHDDPMSQFNRTKKTRSPPDMTFWVELTDGEGHRARCYSAPLWEASIASKLGILSQTTSGRSGDCRDGPVEADISTPLAARTNATIHEHAICRSAGALGWWRRVQSGCLPNSESTNYREKFEDANATNAFFMACQPRISIGEATVVVDSAGVLQEPAKDRISLFNQSSEAIDQFFTNGAQSLMDQSNLFIFRSLDSVWHNDSYGAEYMHYFITRAAGDTHLTDPKQPIPTLQDVEGPINKAYARLFAIWLSLSQELLFLPVDNGTANIPGFVITPEERLHLVTPLFIISEIILGIYTIVSILVYFQRPGRYLPSMPTSIGAVIALFAPSAALQDLQGTSHMTNKEREKFLNDLDYRYGYGSYIGSDGAVHVGIEKVPFVQYLETFNFTGPKAAKKLHTRKEQEAATVILEYGHVPLEDAEEGRAGTLPASGIEVAALPPGVESTPLESLEMLGSDEEERRAKALPAVRSVGVEYRPLEIHDLDELSVSPLEEMLLNFEQDDD